MLNAWMKINDASVVQFRWNSWQLKWNHLSLYRVGTWWTIFMAFLEHLLRPSTMSIM